MTQIASLQVAELTDAQFEEISALVRGLCGINLHTGKKELVKARLSKRIRQLGVCGFREYLQHVRGDRTGAELTAMLDALSTNLTSFFREMQHFEHLKDVILPRLLAQRGPRQRRVRIWSAGCSSGEEPYSIAMVLAASLPAPPSWDARILATDLSTRVLAYAAEGLYGEDRLAGVPGQFRQRFFDLVESRPRRVYQVKDDLRRMISFARLNLLDDWPMRGPFDAIFCRNVMIYFDKPTQARMVERFFGLLGSGGTLFLGHSESLAGVRHRFQYVRPTVYEKP